MAGSLLGGFNNIYGAILGGAIVGISEIMLTTWGQAILGAWIGELGPLIPTIFLIMILLIEPRGLEGIWARIKTQNFFLIDF
jgi:branched-chain amino acid transport system permease protein